MECEFPYHHCHLSRGRSCQRDCQRTCVLCVSAYLRAVRSYAEGRKTITTHLAAAIAAYTGGKETLTPLRQPAAQTDTYSPDHRKDTHTSADGMSVMVDAGKRRMKRGMFTTKSPVECSCWLRRGCLGYTCSLTTTRSPSRCHSALTHWPAFSSRCPYNFASCTHLQQTSNHLEAIAPCLACGGNGLCPPCVYAGLPL